MGDETTDRVHILHHIAGFLGAIVKFQKENITLVMSVPSVCLPVWKNSASNLRIFMTYNI
jgi:hypothetical protein